MISWDLTPDLQEKYDSVVARTRKLQLELGIKPMTLEERYQAYLERKHREEELKKIIGKHRPLPKWKI